MIRMTIQAPSRNFVRANTHITTNVSVAPTAFTTIFSRQRGSWRTTEPFSTISSPGASRPDLRQRRAMPVWDRVKLRKTPMAYKGMSAVTLAWKATMSRHATSASATMPRENTNRLPR